MSTDPSANNVEGTGATVEGNDEDNNPTTTPLEKSTQASSAQSTTIDANSKDFEGSQNTYTAKNKENNKNASSNQCQSQ